MVLLLIHSADVTSIFIMFVLMSVLVCVQVMQAYQAGVAALRISLKGVTVERAENLVDQIQEVIYESCLAMHGL